MDFCYAPSERPASTLVGDSGTSGSTSFRHDVLSGLRSCPKRIPSKYLYDDRGSQLFDEICTLEEYYPTRVELKLMQCHGAEMARCIGDDVALVELGSGSSEKTRVLLDHLKHLICYLPVDISASHLHSAAQRIGRDYPQLDVHPVVADFTATIALPLHCRNVPVRTYFPGSTIGNLETAEASRLLHRIRSMSGGSGGLLVGFDLQKDHEILNRAYNDSKGVTAAFSLNLLSRINRELGADFDLQQFRHIAFYNPACERVEIYLESLSNQLVRISGREFRFSEGERILTEYSHKYTVESFARLAREAGFGMQKVWIDDQQLFAVAYAETFDLE